MGFVVHNENGQPEVRSDYQFIRSVSWYILYILWSPFRDIQIDPVDKCTVDKRVVLFVIHGDDEYDQ